MHLVKWRTRFVVNFTTAVKWNDSVIKVDYDYYYTTTKRAHAIRKGVALLMSQAKFIVTDITMTNSLRSLLLC